jgi:hypothetical protein
MPSEAQLEGFFTLTAEDLVRFGRAGSCQQLCRHTELTEIVIGRGPLEQVAFILAPTQAPRDSGMLRELLGVVLEALHASIGSLTRGSGHGTVRRALNVPPDSLDRSSSWTHLLESLETHNHCCRLRPMLGRNRASRVTHETCGEFERGSLDLVLRAQPLVQAGGAGSSSTKTEPPPTRGS